MNPEKPFDEQRSVQIQRMLEDTVARTPQRGSSVRRRAGLVAALVAVAALLAGGSAAVAFNASAIFAPAEAPSEKPSVSVSTSPTPTPTPTPTITSPAQAAVPGSTLPFGCAELTPSVALAAPTLSTARFFGVDDAAQQQAGVLHCQWNDLSASRLVALDGVADASAGSASVNALLHDGWRSLDVGDASAWSCAVVATGCTAEVVDGAYWLTIDAEGANLTSETGRSVVESSARSMVDALRAHPEPLPQWKPPATSWDGADCAALSGIRASAILGTPGILGPSATKRSAVHAIDGYSPMVACRWSVPDSAVTTKDQPRGVDVDLAPGSAWAWDSRDLTAVTTADPVTVRGADKAQWVCITSEGTPLCWLDVLTDGSWMRVQTQQTTIAGDRERLVAIAEAAIAGH